MNAGTAVRTLEVNPGLDGLVVAETRLSHVDGAQGILILAGLPVERAARAWRYQDAVGALWRDFVPASERLALPEGLAAGRRAGHEVVARLGGGLMGRSPASILRSLLGALEIDEAGPSAPATVAGACASFVAAAARLSRGHDPIAPQTGLGHAADLLAMMGAAASPEAARALETYLVTVMDHGLNASTFAARVVASTGAGLVQSSLAGLCALEGPLHGGAPGPVLDMLDAADGVDDRRAWLEEKVRGGERLMGFGHRIYRVRDPRADVLKAAALELGGGRIQAAQALEADARAVLAEAKPGRPLDTNVEFYTALLLEAVGIDRAVFTPVFAAGRIGGWLAHALEQRATGRIIRPESRYVGSWPAD